MTVIAKSRQEALIKVYGVRTVPESNPAFQGIQTFPNMDFSYVTSRMAPTFDLLAPRTSEASSLPSAEEKGSRWGQRIAEAVIAPQRPVLSLKRAQGCHMGHGGRMADMAQVLSGSATSLLPPHFSQAPLGGVKTVNVRIAHLKVLSTKKLI